MRYHAAKKKKESLLKRPPLSARLRSVEVNNRGARQGRCASYLWQRSARARKNSAGTRRRRGGLTPILITGCLQMTFRPNHERGHRNSRRGQRWTSNVNWSQRYLPTSHMETVAMFSSSSSSRFGKPQDRATRNERMPGKK